MNVPMQSARAWVHDGVRQTGYVRAGSGRTVVLLGGPAIVDVETTPCFSELARSCRVIQPDTLQPAHQLGSWLTGFLDALGVARASLVAFAAHGQPALQYTLSEPERIERLALLLSESEAAAQTIPADAFAERGQQLLVLTANCGELSTPSPELSARLQALAAFLA